MLHLVGSCHSVILAVFGSNMPMAFAAIFGEPQAVLLIDAAAARPRVGERCAEDRDLVGLHIAVADALAAELEQIEIVVVVGRHAVGADLLAARVLGLAHVLELAGLDVEPVARVVLLVVGPHLAVDVGMLRRHHRGLRRGRLPVLREAVGFDLVGLAVDLRMPAWYIIESQRLPSGSNSMSRPPFGCSGLSTGMAMSFTCPVFWSITPTNWLPKSEYQTWPSCIDDHVVRHAPLCAAGRIR